MHGPAEVDLPNPGRPLSAERLRAKLWRHRVIESALRRTGIWSLMERGSRPGRRLEVTRHAVPAPLASSLTVALLADLHLPGQAGEADAMLAAVREERPDLILIAGDITGPSATEATYAGVLSRLAAPRGVWMVPGNWDYWLPVPDLGALCRRTGVRLLVNAAAELAPGVWLAGLDDDVAGAPDPDLAFRDVPPGAWTMAMVHCPSGFDAIAARCALALAGHTHGGQIRVPGLPPLWLPAGCGRYVAGWYARDGSRLYVSRGIASKGLPMRLFCRPEVAIFRIGGPSPGRRP